MEREPSVEGRASAAVLPADTLRRIVAAGIAAPSAENRHLLRFQRAGAALRLVSTDAATWQAEPHRRVLALLSYGAVIENMGLRAAACGFAQQVQWWPDRSCPDVVADCRWTPAPPAADPLERAIEGRHTNRRFYRREALPREALQRMAAAAGAIGGAGVRWLDAPDLRALALRAARRAETERFCRPGLHRELYEAIRFDAGWQASVDEGLPPAALEVEPPMRPLFAALARWPRMRAATRFGLHHSFGLRAAYLPARLAPHLGLVVCDAADAAVRPMLAGRALQRAWLAATLDDVAFQPLAAPVVLLHQRAGGEWVSPAVQAGLRDDIARLADGDAGTAWMLFRVGRAGAVTARTGRPPAERFIDPA